MGTLRLNYLISFLMINLFSFFFNTNHYTYDFLSVLSWHSKSHVILGGSRDCRAYTYETAREVFNNFVSYSGRMTCGDFTLDGIHKSHFFFSFFGLQQYLFHLYIL